MVTVNENNNKKIQNNIQKQRKIQQCTAIYSNIKIVECLLYFLSFFVVLCL